MRPPPGSWSSMRKNVSSAGAMVAAVLSEAMTPVSRWSQMAVPPMMVKATTMIVIGRNSTPSTYWRMVRPCEILAVKMPTKGAQLTHHAQ